MSFPVRDGSFDVLVAAGPRVEFWPSPGVRALTSICAEMGLKVGVFGGEMLRVRGVIPLPGTGAMVLIEDVQHRIHRIHARAVVKVSPPGSMPDPFPGWNSSGLIPISTALRLRRESRIAWDPCTVILGSGNRALRFGTELLESGVSEVFCVETLAQWGAKRFSAWEVEKRRFEMAGGKLIEAKPAGLTPKAAQLWEIRLRDAQGVRLIEATRIVSAGPFSHSVGIHEHPSGSFLFEMEQTALQTKEQDVEGWVMEEERGKFLGSRIAKALANDLGEKREELERIYRRARGRLRRYFKHLDEPFTPVFQGKWLSASDSRRVRSFSGTPQKEHLRRPMASIDCFEEIPCNVCQTVCPEAAIQIGKVPRPAAPVLTEDKCTACGICVSACPSEAILLLHESENRSVSQLTLPWRGEKPWNVGEFATLLNRRGENLGSGRVLSVTPGAPEVVQQVQIEVPTHLAWEARGLRRSKAPPLEEMSFLEIQRIELTFNGEKRLVRDQIPVTTALFEIGKNRPEDALFCPDGSCGLCQLEVDGVKKLACQTQTRRGMAIKFLDTPVLKPVAPTEAPLCPCLGITAEQVIERIRQGNLQSPDAVLSVSHVGEGKCHGQICMGALHRLMAQQGIETSQWIDWRFPFSEWALTPTSS